MPAEFNGGTRALQSFLKDNLIWNPPTAINPDFHDSLVMSFVVNKGGGLVYTNVEKEPATTDEDLKYSMMKAAYDLLGKHMAFGFRPYGYDKYVFAKHSLHIEFNSGTAVKF
ncbi:MAG: hypothetical protein U5K79_16160 [Cyclobacteriaceae bacterium]|nr:hypothetical protein [Cyclobacteriaceae bacterium]